MFNEIKNAVKMDGAEIEFSTGKFARQASGAVMIKQGNSMLLCTTVSAKTAKKESSFFPLTVNYIEKAYSAGRIPGGFLKREGGGRSDREVLISRLIDRPIRPLFDSRFFNETNVICTLHSYDEKYDTDILAIIGASAAIAISGVPYLDIVAASRVGYINGQFILNPSPAEQAKSDLDLVVAGTKDSVMMVESEANLLSEEKMLEAVKFGHAGFQPIIKAIEELVEAVGNPKWEVEDLYPNSLLDEIRELTKDDITKAFSIKQKQERYAAIDVITQTVLEKFGVDEKYNELQLLEALSSVKSEVLRNDTLKKAIRIDGRKPDQIRKIECEVDLFPSVHGSSLFTRGETQALVFTTLGTGQDEQIIDNVAGEYRERFLLNYIFPPYAVGEVGPLKAPSRREIGHGKLAWRSLNKVMPTKEEFPYTVRVVSEIIECNGSSSMATVCGASMSMMDAGVPLKTPIAGIAMGLIKEGDNFMVLSDIIADEDHLGDMDFKVAGGSEGVTALQMDIKVAGITFDIMEKALEQAKIGRLHIIEQMSKAISSKSEISATAPIIEHFVIKKDKIREIIGPGGSVIRDICETTGAKIDINDDGEVSVFAVGKEKLQAAVARIKEIAFDPEVGAIFEGKVVKIIPAGAFVNFYGNKDGFVHISEISDKRVDSIDKVLEEGQIVKVKFVGYERGKAKLTIKNLNTALEDIEVNNRTKDSQNNDNTHEAVSKKKIAVKSSSKPEPKKNKNPKNLVKEDFDKATSERKYFS